MVYPNPAYGETVELWKWPYGKVRPARWAALHRSYVIRTATFATLGQAHLDYRFVYYFVAVALNTLPSS